MGRERVAKVRRLRGIIRGTVPGSHKDAIEIPDLYAVYAEGHHKPMAIVETAILYSPAAPAGGPTEAELKASWFAEVFASAIRREFPRIKMVNWFEWRRTNREVGRVIDWRLGGDPALARALLDSVPKGWLRFRRRLTVLRRPNSAGRAARSAGRSRPICGPRPPDPQAAPAPSIGRIAR